LLDLDHGEIAVSTFRTEPRFVIRVVSGKNITLLRTPAHGSGHSTRRRANAADDGRDIYEDIPIAGRYAFRPGNGVTASRISG
jgi:hypothetical protein